MTDDIAGDDARYWAFISYSHRDAAFGRRLHRRLENYALPRRLVGRDTAQGAVPKKLAPIFRDREELPAAHDLSTEVRAALKASRSLIVVCSPSSAASQWVGREIEVFRELHPGRPILAAVRDGEPADCFPKALHGIGPGGVPIEPLAADFRRGRDGEQLGLLKLVAGIIGLGLDELIQRDAHRRNQRVTAVTAGALAAVIVMGVLTGYALSARSEADRQRGEAEGLVEYMLTDLRDKLKGVGRLDVMTAVNERALKYYSDKDLSKLPVDSLERRARIFHAMGEDDETRGDHDAALAEFREARRTTATLLADDPNNPERIFDQSQSEYFFGSVDYARGRYATAKSAFLAYSALADRMVAIAPKSTKYRMEAGYAESNLCSVAIKNASDPAGALKHCAAALAQTGEALQHPDKNYASAGERKTIANELMNCLANMADAYSINGDLARAKDALLRESAMLSQAMSGDPKNTDLKDTWVALQIELARVESKVGGNGDAHDRLARALPTAEELHHIEPTNKRWTSQVEFIEKEMRSLEPQAH